VVVEDTGIGEQYNVVPVLGGGEQEMSMEVNAANSDAGIDEQPDGFSAFSTVTTEYVEQTEVI